VLINVVRISIILLVSLSAWANPLPEVSLFSQQLIKLLSANKFTCSVRSADAGFRCRGNMLTYPQPVNVFIPMRLDREPDTLAMHFHGFNVCGSSECHFDLATGNGNYGKFLSTYAKHSILVIPESTGSIETYLKHFKNASILDSFIAEIISMTQISNLQGIKISSHSGSYKMIYRFANWQLSENANEQSQFLKKTKAVGLFDSLYEKYPSIPIWISSLAQADSEFYFLGSYVHNSPIDRQSAFMYMKWLETVLPANSQTTYLDIKNSSHFGIMKDGQMTEFLKDN